MVLKVRCIRVVLVMENEKVIGFGNEIVDNNDSLHVLGFSCAIVYF